MAVPTLCPWPVCVCVLCVWCVCEGVRSCMARWIVGLWPEVPNAEGQQPNSWAHSTTLGTDSLHKHLQSLGGVSCGPEEQAAVTTLCLARSVCVCGGH